MNWERFLHIDRRIIFLTLAVVILLPLIFPFEQPMYIQKPTQAVFDAIEAIDPERQVLLISTDYVPQTEAENQPMTIALIRHALARNVRVLMISLYIESAGLANAAMDQVVAEFNSRAASPADSIVYGRDIGFLGWQPPPIVPIISMGRSISGIYPTDFFGTPTDSLAVMQGVRNYDQVGLICSVSGGSAPLWFVQFAQPRFGVKVAAGCTAVSAPDFYPYFATGQFSGMLGGMKGAAEYEKLVQEKYGIGGRRRANEGMGSQSLSHLLIMAFVVIGNVAYFAGKRRKAQ